MEPSEVTPERGLKVTMMLADAAQVSEGKLYVLGGGWTVIGPQPMPFSIAGQIEVPWHLTNRQHVFRFECIDLDGNAVMVSTPDGEEPLFAEGGFEVGRPPGVRTGTTIPVPFAFGFGPQPFPTGSHFEWRLTINGETNEDWRLAFATRPEAQSFAA